MTVIKQKESPNFMVEVSLINDNRIIIKNQHNNVPVEKESIPALIEELKNHLPK